MVLSAADQKKLALVLVWALLGLTVYFRFLIGPQFAKFKLRGDEIQALKSRMTELDGADAKLERLNTEREKLLKELSGSEAFFVHKNEILQLLGRVSKLAVEHDVQISGIKEVKRAGAFDRLAPKKDASGKSTVTRTHLINLELLSGYHALGAFVNALEGMRPVFQLVDMEIRPQPTDSRRHRMTLLIKGFVARDKDENNG